MLTPTNAARLAWSLPRHVAKVRRLMENFERRTGKRLAVVRGYASEAQQAAVYADSLAGGRQVYRAAPADKSKHPKGAATDLHVVGDTTGDAATDAKHPSYAVLADEAEKVGLKAGLRFKSGLPDPYHVEEPESLTTLAAEFVAFTEDRAWQAGLVVVAAALMIAGVGLILKHWNARSVTV